MSPSPRQPGLTAAGQAWANQLALVSYLVLAVMPILGISQAWTEGLTVRLGPFLTLPALVPENHTGWMFFGYFHSALGFSFTLLTLAAIVTGIWLWLRRGVGLLAAFPPGFGAQVYATLVITVYAFSTFKSPEPGVTGKLHYVAITINAVFFRNLRNTQGREVALGVNLEGALDKLAEEALRFIQREDAS